MTHPKTLAFVLFAALLAAGVARNRMDPFPAAPERLAAEDDLRDAVNESPASARGVSLKDLKPLVPRSPRP